ncbi:terminase [Lactococcus garvieae]|uniref:terminase n=1 Tax=Lactococcus garvieae TaxID=1363 RepID=UPI003852E33B
MPILENARHEKFVQSLIAGMSQRVSYREAFPKAKRWKNNTVDSRASELLKVSEVLGRYKELQEEAQDAAIMSRKDRMIKLSEIAQNDEEPSSQIKAIDTLNKMDGDYISKVELSGSVDIKSRSQEIQDRIKGRLKDG